MKAIKIILIFLAIAALWWLSRRLNVFQMVDYVEYWSSGRLNLTGGNPYDPAQMLLIERSVGWKDPGPLMMLNPPWILPLAMFLGIFDYNFSHFIWFILQICIIGVCSMLLWRIYSGPQRSAWISWMLLFTFGPILHTLKTGQVTILILLGIVGFLYFVERKSDLLAGAFASLVFIKPQLVYLFILAIILWSISSHRYRVLLGMCTATIVSLAVVSLINPHVISQYIVLVRFYPLNFWLTSTLGTFIRQIIDTNKFYLQFIPLIAGLIWFLVYWQKRGKTLDWSSQLPLIVLVSLTTTPYAWTTDYSVIIIGVIQISVLFMVSQWNIIKGMIFAVYWIADLLITFLIANQNWFWWFTGVLLIWYILSLGYLIRNKSLDDKAEVLIAT